MKNLIYILIILIPLLVTGCSADDRVFTYSQIQGMKENGDVETVLIDDDDNVLVTNDYEHHELHEGNTYYVKDYMSVTGAGTNVDFLWLTGPREIHAFWTLYGTDAFTINLYEGVTVSANGSAVATFNANRNSSKTTLVSAYSSPTLAGGALGDNATGGVEVWSAILGADRAAGITGFEDFIAKRNTAYWFRITKTNANAHLLDYDFYWIEAD